jgi:hypothetical protein
MIDKKKIKIILILIFITLLIGFIYMYVKFYYEIQFTNEKVFCYLDNLNISIDKINEMPLYENEIP